MTAKQRIDRIRNELVRLGERAFAANIAQDHTDFSDFSEKSGPGDRDPNFNDFIDK